ncbi:MAG TPA: DUF2059 domain-containing protein [Xanthobacteraceae bacterium]|jgi:hypothetical protein
MRLLRPLFALVLLAGLSGNAPEETPSSEALQAASELLSILSGDMTKQLAAMLTNGFWPAIEQRAHAQNIDDATLSDLRKEFERIMVNVLADAMKGAPQIYAQHFTASELRELTAFYRTPTGTKTLVEMPKVTGEFAASLMPRVQSIQQQMGDAFDKTLRAHGYLK